MLQELLTIIKMALTFAILYKQSITYKEKMKYLLQFQIVHININFNIESNVVVDNESKNNTESEAPVSVVYMSCFDRIPVNPSKFTIPSYKVSCSDKSKYNDECFEAVPYLRFIYDHYYSNGKFIFIHGHVYSWHNNNNRDSVYNVINRRMRSKQFKNDKFGTLFAHLPHETPTWKENKNEDELFYLIYHDTSMM